MARTAHILFLLIAAMLPAAGQDAQAIKVLNAGIDVLGGAERIRSLKSIYYSAKGTEDGSANGQDFLPGKNVPTAHEEKLAVFMDGVRLAYEYKTARGDGTTRWRRYLFGDGRRIVADLGPSAVYASPVKFPSADRDQDARRIPHAFLLEVLANASQLRYIGTRAYDNREHEVISLTLPGAKTPISLYLDKQTKLLSKYEFVTDFPALGSSLVEYVFTDHRPNDRLKWFPTEQRIVVNGKTWRSVKFDRVLADSNEAEAMFQLPPELEGFVAASGSVKEIAKGVYLVYGIGGSYQPMFIEFKDFVVAVEAPALHPSLEDTPVESVGNVDALTREFIEKIKQTVPNKPVKYLVLTHSHSDHMGGLRAFLAERPTILTTPGNRSFYERFAPGMAIVTFDKKKVITDGERTVELFNVGRNPHTEENVAVFLPKENYVFQGDLFYFNNEASFPPRDRMTVMPFFANWLKENDLSPDRIYGFHSPTFGTMRHIEKVRAMAEKGSAPLAGAWEGEVTRSGRRWKVAMNALESGDELKASVDFIDLDVVDISFPVTRWGDRFRLERPQPSGNSIVFDGEVINNTFIGKWNGFGVEGSFAMKRREAAARAYREEEVTFANADIALSGTLLVPNGREKSPAVILVHGSSPNERATYRSWARHFAENGIAALIYDKRGSGKSTGNTRAASMEDLAGDAIAGIKMLKLRRDIDAGKVGIAGHSQGGWIAPLAAAMSDDVAFVIVSGAAAVTPAEQSIFHRAGVMREAGITENEIAEATRLREKLYLLNRKIIAKDADVVEMRTAISKELTDNKDARWFGPAELPPELNGELPPRGALELLFFDASSVWPRVRVPVLAMWGSRDTVVPVEKSKAMIEEFLSKAGNKDLTIRVFQGVDHGKAIAATREGWDFPRASAEYDLAMVEWLKKKVS